MKNEPNQKRIIILSVLAALAYGFIMLNDLFSDIHSVRSGFDGDEFRIIHNEQVYDESQSLTHPKVYFLQIKPSRGYRHYPDQIKNLKTETILPTRFSHAEIAIPENYEFPTGIKTLKTINLFVIFSIIILFIIIPFTFIRLLWSLYNGWVFHLKNIQSTRKLGFLLITTYILIGCSNYLSHLIHQKIFYFQDYRLAFRLTDNYLLIMGIALLLMSEIMVRGLQLKEEQDLTV
ncbi:MAG: DUF2975 domain-containing protein [Bacteroidetes bacterium]|nr:MAG: DUF2975 domain-containing protein [Bacteroidota bacterium]